MVSSIGGPTRSRVCCLLMGAVCAVNLGLLMQFLSLSQCPRPPPAPPTSPPPPPPSSSSVSATLRLIGPDDYGSGCPKRCGCPATPKDCPQWYSMQDILDSTEEGDEAILQENRDILADAAKTARSFCSGSARPMDRGGWCLTEHNNITKPRVVHNKFDVSYPMANSHVIASTRVAEELSKLITSDHIKSINDFGAGIAQYKSAILNMPQHSDLIYNAYDGAGNGENYTHNMLQYADLTIPLDFPVADWVLSLEVGEHVPSKYEGMLIRNIHRHNRKGVILSWGVLGQRGHMHINLHSNDYIIRVFEGLGYEFDAELTNKFRVRENNYNWFVGSIMVFRRLELY